jgi:hypothetical protein
LAMQTQSNPRGSRFILLTMGPLSRVPVGQHHPSRKCSASSTLRRARTLRYSVFGRRLHDFCQSTSHSSPQKQPKQPHTLPPRRAPSPPSTFVPNLANAPANIILVTLSQPMSSPSPYTAPESPSAQSEPLPRQSHHQSLQNKIPHYHTASSCPRFPRQDSPTIIISHPIRQNPIIQVIPTRMPIPRQWYHARSLPGTSWGSSISARGLIS